MEEGLTATAAVSKRRNDCSWTEAERETGTTATTKNKKQQHKETMKRRNINKEKWEETMRNAKKDESRIAAVAKSKGRRFHSEG